MNVLSHTTNVTFRGSNFAVNRPCINFTVGFTCCSDFNSWNRQTRSRLCISYFCGHHAVVCLRLKCWKRLHPTHAARWAATFRYGFGRAARKWPSCNFQASISGAHTILRRFPLSSLSRHTSYKRMHVWEAGVRFILRDFLYRHVCNGFRCRNNSFVSLTPYTYFLFLPSFINIRDRQECCGFLNLKC
jgi:hypothetical protein